MTDKMATIISLACELSTTGMTAAVHSVLLVSTIMHTDVVTEQTAPSKVRTLTMPLPSPSRTDNEYSYQIKKNQQIEVSTTKAQHTTFPLKHNSNRKKNGGINMITSMLSLLTIACSCMVWAGFYDPTLR